MGQEVQFLRNILAKHNKDILVIHPEESEFEKITLLLKRLSQMK